VDATCQQPEARRLAMASISNMPTNNNQCTLRNKTSSQIKRKKKQRQRIIHHQSNQCTKVSGLPSAHADHEACPERRRWLGLWIHRNKPAVAT
jgi:hypothetical protein